MKSLISTAPDFQNSLESFITGCERLSRLEAAIFHEFSLLREIYPNKQEFSLNIKNFLDECPWKKTLSNPDRLLATIQYGVKTSFNWYKDEPEFSNEPKEQMLTMLEYSYSSLPEIDKRSEKFASNCKHFSSLDDSSLKMAAKNSLSVTYKKLWEPSGRTIYTKLNHGFWEFFFSAYSPFEKQDYISKNIRDRRETNRPKATHMSGFYEAFSSLVEDASIKQAESVDLQFGIGIGAGDDSLAHMLESPLATVSRGALIGMLAFWDAFDFEQKPEFRDGCEPRDVLFEKKLPEFMQNHVYPAQACLVISPKHLKDIELPMFEGDVFHLSIPHVVVHQTWRSSLALVIGEIERLLTRYEKITVLMQGANFASMAALALEQVFNASERSRMKFFDLGRLLDVARPDICERYPSFKPLFEAPEMFDEIQAHLKCDASE